MRQWRIDAIALRLAAALLIGAVAAAPAARGDSRPATESSFSAAGLKRVGDYFDNEVSSGRIPGAVVLIQQHGKPVYFEAFGMRDPVAKAPMTKDAIFRLYSMSKPITSVAVMMLVDDGKIALHDPLSRYIPAFADGWRSSRKHCGTTAIRPTCSAGWWRWFPGNRCISSRRNGCSIRWG
jgi:CubicO group peptidase (beta-lactamase class C family)